MRYLGTIPRALHYRLATAQLNAGTLLLLLLVVIRTMFPCRVWRDSRWLLGTQPMALMTKPAVPILFNHALRTKLILTSPVGVEETTGDNRGSFGRQKIFAVGLPGSDPQRGWLHSRRSAGHFNRSSPPRFLLPCSGAQQPPPAVPQTSRVSST